LLGVVMGSDVWVEERFGDFYGMRYRVSKTLFSGKSDFQSVDVVETVGHGRMLLNDGLVMVTERDEFIYHDMITHVPLFTHPNPKKVLVIGGGDGGTAREVIRHKSVEKCVMVEIDKMVVDACLEFIPQTSSKLSDPRVDLIIGDGVEYVNKTKEKFDVIIVDSTDPIGPATPLFGPEFYGDLYNCLNDDGIVVAQGESPFLNQPMQKTLMKIISEKFKISMIYNFSNLTYPGGLWSFAYGAKKYHPIRDFDEAKVKASGMSFKYYNKEIHRGAFAIPTFMRENIESFIKA